MSIDYAALKVEINNDPAGLGYKNEGGSWKDDDVIVGLITAKNISSIGSLSILQLLRWAARHDSIRRMETHQTDAGPIGSICTAALAIFKSQSGIMINLGDTEIRGMFDALISGGIFTQVEENDLLALGTVLKSRAEILGIPEVSSGDINHTRSI